LTAEQRDFFVRRALQRSAAERTGTEQHHLRTIQAQLEAIARGDFDAVLLHAHDDVTLDIFAPPEFPWLRQPRGAGEFRQAVARNFGALDEQRPDVREIFVDGGTVIVFGREHGVIRQPGIPYEIEFVERFTFRKAAWQRCTSWWRRSRVHDGDVHGP
jgi:ketosteroid isomerase-like protein